MPAPSTKPTTADQIAQTRQRLEKAQREAEAQIEALKTKEFARINRVMERCGFLEVHHSSDELTAMFEAQLQKKRVAPDQASPPPSPGTNS